MLGFPLPLLSQNPRNRTTVWSSKPSHGYISKGSDNSLLERHTHNHVYCRTLTIIKIWNPPTRPLMLEWRKISMIYMQEDYYLTKKRSNSVTWSDMDQTICHIMPSKINQSQKKRKTESSYIKQLISKKYRKELWLPALWAGVGRMTVKTEQRPATWEIWHCKITLVGNN